MCSTFLGRVLADPLRKGVVVVLYFAFLIYVALFDNSAL